jgi:8-oxo-dGTP pyrophosphatase MutT (NUDIX family)
VIQLNVKIRAGRIIKGVLDDDLNYSKKDSAAILFPLMVDERINLVMIMRQRNLSRSAGHIAFPGGIKEEGELPFETALREAEEELGIKKSGVDILGYLNPKEVMESRIKIHPVVGIFEKQRFIPDSFEVRKVLVDDLIKVLKSRRIADWGPNYECDRELVWGASSRILDDFYLRVVRSFGSVENFENTIYREV